MSDSSYGSVMVEGVVYIDEREIAKRDAEIESLRLQVKMIPLPEYRDDPRLHEVIEEQKAEIERLRRENADLAAGWQRTYDHDCNLMKAEIERLRGLLREALDPYLRAAIDWQAGWTDRVRKALGD